MMTANNEFRVSQGNENWEPIFKMMFGCFGEDKNLFPPLGSETRSSSLYPSHYTILPSSLLKHIIKNICCKPHY
jgi:hypothetical protein